MGALDNFIEGLKQGYMDQGGVTPSNVFNGPTPRAGDAPSGFSGGAGGIMGSLFGNISDIALRTLPEVLKDPESFLNENGELSLTRFAIPEFRREKQKEARDQEEIRKSALAASAITQGQNLLESALGLRTNEARAAAAGVFGGDPRYTSAMDAANAESAAARPAALEAGLLPGASALSMPKDSIEAALAFQRDRLAREQNVQQFGLSKQLEAIRNRNRITEIGYTGEVRGANAQHETELRDWGDDRKVQRRFGSSVQQKKYQAELDEWKRQRSDGATPDPYPVLQGLVDSGAFDQSPNTKAAAQAHLTTPTDAKNAAGLIDAWQNTVTDPPKGTTGTMTERRDSKALKNLRRNLRGGNVPDDLRPEARNALRSGDAIAARQLTGGLLGLKLKAPKAGGAWLPTAQQYMGTPGFDSQPEKARAALALTVETGNEAAAKLLMESILKNDVEGTGKLLSNPMFNKIIGEGRDAMRSADSWSRAEAAVLDPAGNPREDLFGPYIAMMDFDSPVVQQALRVQYGDKWLNDKQALRSVAGDGVTEFIRSKSGLAMTESERREYKSIAPNGVSEGTLGQYLRKAAVMRRAAEREAEIRAEEAKGWGAALSQGDTDAAVDSILSRGAQQAYRDNAAWTLAELKRIQSDPAVHSDADLNAAEQAELDRRGYKR